MVCEQLAVIDNGEGRVRRGSILGLPVCLDFYYLGFKFVSFTGHISYFVGKPYGVRALARTDYGKALIIFF